MPTWCSAPSWLIYALGACVFASSRDWRSMPEARDNKPVLARLFHLAYLHAHRLDGCELLVIEVNPRHVAFYRRMLGFQVRSEARLNPRVNAEAVLMTLDLVWGSQQVERFAGQPELASTTRTLFPYFYPAAEEASMLLKLRQ